MPVARNGEVELSYQHLPCKQAGESRTLVLIMGIEFTAAHWGEHFLEPLAESHRLLVFDNRGTGFSTKRVPEITAESWAADVCAVMDAAGVECADILGYSMGGRVALELALRHRQRLNRLMLLSSVLGGPNAILPSAQGISALLPRLDMSREQAARERISAVAATGFAERHPTRIEALVALSVAKPTHPLVLEDQLSLVGDDIADQLESLDVPTMVVHGDADELVPFGNGERLAERIEGATLHRLEGVGHLAHWEQPDRVLELAKQHFA